MKKLKISILFILIFLCIICIKHTSQATEINIVGNVVAANPGDTVKVQYITIGIDSNNKLGAFEAKLGQTDSRLTQIGTLSTNIGISGDVLSYFYTDDNSAVKKNVVVEAEFKIPSSMPKGEIAVPLMAEVLMDADANDYAKTVNAIINVGGTNNAISSTVSGKSTDATLKSLTITPAKLTPNFSSNVLNYNTTVDTNVNKIDVSAVPNNSKATYNILGNTYLGEGTNVIRVVVTAESGAEKVYKIIILKKAAEVDTNTIIPNIEKMSTATSANILDEKQPRGGDSSQDLSHNELLNAAQVIHSSSQQIGYNVLKWIIIIVVGVIIIIVIFVYIRIRYHH